LITDGYIGISFDMDLFISFFNDQGYPLLFLLSFLAATILPIGFQRKVLSLCFVGLS